MLSNLIGNVDIPAAAVLIALSITICVIVTTMIAKRRSRVDVNNEFELAKMKVSVEADSAQYRNETARSIEFKKIDQGLITSHRQE